MWELIEMPPPLPPHRVSPSQCLNDFFALKLPVFGKALNKQETACYFSRKKTYLHLHKVDPNN